MNSTTEMNPRSKPSLSKLTCETASRDCEPSSTFGFECCHIPPCVGIDEDANRGKGSPLPRQLIPRLPPRRRNFRVDRLARQLAALNLEDRSFDNQDIIMGEPSPEPFYKRLNPLPPPHAKLLGPPVQFNLPGPSYTRLSVAPDPVKSDKPQLASGVVCCPIKLIPEIQVPEDDAFQGSPMSICWPTPLPGSKVNYLSPASPMSICRLTPLPRPMEHALSPGSPMSICPPTRRRLPLKDSAIRGLSSTKLSPQLEHQDFAIQCSPLPRPATPPPPLSRLYPEVRASLAALHGRSRPDEPPISPPGTWLQELREMGEYGPPLSPRQTLTIAAPGPLPQSPPSSRLHVEVPAPPTALCGRRPDEPPISPLGSFLEELREMGEYDTPTSPRPRVPLPPPKPEPPSLLTPRLPPMDFALQGRTRTEESLISPPGSFLEELREMGMYNGPSGLQNMAWALHISEEDALRAWHRH